MTKEAIRAWAVASELLDEETFNHSLRVAKRVWKKDIPMAVAFLHDVVEEGVISLDALRELGFLQGTVEAVDAISRRDGETYFGYIERVKLDNVARLVKIADLNDNLLGREHPPSPPLAKRYEKARGMLQWQEGERFKVRI